MHPPVVARSEWFFCLADEHFFATVLAVYRRGGETDCMGHVVAANWSEHTVHPVSFEPEDVTAALCASTPRSELVIVTLSQTLTATLSSILTRTLTEAKLLTGGHTVQPVPASASANPCDIICLGQ